jgi:hypothetical protein
MTKDELKQLEEMMKRPVKEIVEILKSKISKLELYQSVVTEQVRSIKEQ